MRPREAASASGCGAAPSTGATTGTVDVSTSRADTLPSETTLHLLDFLDAVSLSQCAQTSAAWCKIASADQLWQRRCKSEFGFAGGQADYASRWKQEKHRALANLQLYLDYLDEIHFALAAFFALVSLFIAFPTLLVLKIDGWLAISWTQVFGCIYGLSFISVLFVLVRMTLFATVFSPVSSLKSCIIYCSVIQIARRILANRDVLRKVGVLIAVPIVVAVIPLTIHLFADRYLATLRLAALLTWTSVGSVTYYAKHTHNGKRSTHVDLVLTCCFTTSSLLLAKATVTMALPWCAIACPFATLPALTAAHSFAQHNTVFKRIYGRPGTAPGPGPGSATLRRLPSTSTWTWLALYYHNHPPLVSLAMLALKLDGVLTRLPWALVMVDYGAWVINGPLALHARHLLQVMFREMPIPATLRKL
jgi:hypothetical protein